MPLYVFRKDNMLTVEHLTKKYGRRTVVNDLSFTADKGEILGLLGPNGAGKSKTMNMLTGYIAPDSGSIILDDMDLNPSTITFETDSYYAFALVYKNVANEQ